MTVEDTRPSNGNQRPFADFKTGPSSPHLGLGSVFMKKSTATWTVQDELFNDSLVVHVEKCGNKLQTHHLL